MKGKMLKRILAVALALVLTLGLATVGTFADEAENPVEGKKVAYIMLLPSASIFQMWKDSCVDLANELGATCDFFFCDGDFNKWQDTISQCASAGYDGGAEAEKLA